MKQVALALLALLAAAGLYALPMAPRDACPTEQFWGCTGQFDSLDDVPAPTPTILVDTTEDDGELPSVTVDDGELVISRSTIDPDDLWFFELPGNTKWLFGEAKPAEDTTWVAVTYRSERIWEGAPRVMQAHPSRLQILEPRQRDVQLDVELPDLVDSIEWAEDGRLLVFGANGTVSVYELVDNV